MPKWASLVTCSLSCDLEAKIWEYTLYNFPSYQTVVSPHGAHDVCVERKFVRCPAYKYTEELDLSALFDELKISESVEPSRQIQRYPLLQAILQDNAPLDFSLQKQQRRR